MANRFRRRRPHRHSPGSPHVEGAATSRRRRIIRTTFWLGAAFLLLVAVLGYDRNAVQEAAEYVKQAEEHIDRAAYDEAIVAYQRAFDNPRLSRARKAEIALAVGDLEFERFKDYDSALAWYQRAKRIHPRTIERPLLKQRVADASRLAAGGAGARRASGDGSSAGVQVQQVQLVAAPSEDERGPVLAAHSGGALHAGAVARALRDLPLTEVEALRNNPAKFEQFLRAQLNRDLLYRAAVEAGYDKAPDVSARVYDYQRTLISDRYVADLRHSARTIPNEKVEEYYRANADRYSQPGRVGVAMIKTENAERAEEARRHLVSGLSFGDVASSYSVDQASARTQGVVGLVQDTDTSIPGVGVAPDVVKSLFTLPTDKWTSPTQIHGSWFIFRVLSRSPRHITTLEEARPAIERTLRAQQGSDVTSDLPATLLQKYQARLESAQLTEFWNYLQNPEGTTTGTLSSQGATTSTAPNAPGGAV